MEEIEEPIPEGYLEAFNTGYTFSKVFPDVGKQIIEQNNILSENKESEEKDISPLAGIFHGINQQVLEQRRDLLIERYNELKNIDDEKIEGKDYNIER